ncbi:MAG: antibiotic biosynthesis monooxygenase [Spirosoma sp.]|nr:antibiotic biosynthesis monooxygenase [Spirosoma sp.]
MIANTPPPPYYAVIFTSIRTSHLEGYGDMATRMVELAHGQAGFLGVESARDSHSDRYAGAGPFGITVSYWQSLEAIRQWKQHAEHLIAQQTGRDRWYASYKTRICLVERDYAFESA